MKKKLISCLPALPGLAMLAGIKTVFAPCIHADGSAAACAGLGNAVFILGIIMAAAALLRALLSGKSRIAVDVLLLLTSAGVLLTPALCKSCTLLTMRCNRVTSPAVRFGGAACLVVFVILLVNDIHTAKGKRA